MPVVHQRGKTKERQPFDADRHAEQDAGAQGNDRPAPVADCLPQVRNHGPEPEHGKPERNREPAATLRIVLAGGQLRDDRIHPVVWRVGEEPRRHLHPRPERRDGERKCPGRDLPPRVLLHVSRYRRPSPSRLRPNPFVSTCSRRVAGTDRPRAPRCLPNRSSCSWRCRPSSPSAWPSGLRPGS